MRGGVVSQHLIIAVGAAVLTLAGTSSADTTRLSDPNDTRGKLDVKYAVQGHRLISKVRMIRHRLTMRGRWNRRALKPRNNFINFFFDTDDDKGFERRLNIAFRGARLRAKMQTWRSLKKVGIAKLWRPNRRSITVAFPEAWLGKNVDAYRWIGFANYSIAGRGPCGVQTDVYKICSDRLPNQNHRFTHTL
jgi:hypothetical protein